MRASSSTLLLVSVLDQNDNFPQFVRSVYEGYVRESASVGSMVLTNSSTPLVVKAVDKDRGLNALLRYDMVENGPENRLFSVDTNTGEFPFATQKCAVKTKGILDFETMPVVEFKIRVSDSGTPSLRADTVAIVRVHVEDVNDTPPQFDSLFYNATLHLPTYKGVAVAQLNASDPDSSRDSLRFELVHGNEDGAFVLDPVSGLLSIANPGVLDKTHELQVSVSDGKYSGATVVRINCETSLDSGLRFEMDRYEASVEENSTRILIVEIVNLLGLRLNEHVEFRILNPSELFEIGLTSGAIRTCGIPFDRELQEKYEIIIEAVSDAGEYGRRVAHALVEVTVTDINDNRPMFLNLPYYTVMSVSSEQGDVVIQLEAIDLDTGENGRIRYDLVRGEGEIFRVEPRTGKVVLKRALGSDRTSYDILVAAYDGGKVPMFAETTVHIKVMDRLMPVFNKQFFNATVPENAEPYTAVINVVAESPQGRKLIYGISRGNEYEEFGFDFNTGSIFVGDALDYELKSEYELYLRASDSVSGAYSEVPVNIRVTDVNDNPPVFSKLSYEASVSELRAVGAEILKVQASDRDEGMNGAFRYSLEDISLDANSTTWFRVNPITGLITLSRPLDHERMPVHRFHAVATDSGMPALSSSVTVWVTVDDVNDNPPVFEKKSYTSMLLENAERGQFVTKVTAFDIDDSDVGNLKYSIIEGNNAQTFLIDRTTGVVRLKNVQKFKNTTSYVLNVSATDGVFTCYARLQIDLLSANKHEPRFSRSSYDANVAENVPSGTSVLQVKAFDEDHGEFGSITYSIESDIMREKFKIDAQTGEIRTRQQLDREEQDMYHIPIVATDSGAKRGYATVHVNVTDVNDNIPKFQAYKYIASIHANATEGSMVAKVMATDADVGASGTIEYSLYESDTVIRASSIFGVHAATGEIFLRKPVDGFDNEVFQFFVRARDNGIPSLHADVPVDVVIMDELDTPPTFEKRHLEFFISERDDVGTLVAQLKATSNSTVLYELLTADAREKSSVFRVDQDGRIIVNQKPNREEKDSYALTILALTESTPPLTAMVDVTVKIMDENDNAPEFQSVPYHVTVAESIDIGGTVLRVSAHDADASAEIRYSLESAGDLKELLPITSVFSIDPYSGVITTLVPLDRETVSEYRLNVIASDNGSPPLTAATQIYIDVMDYNDNPPIFTEDPYYTSVSEDVEIGTSIMKLRVQDADALESPYLQFFITDGDKAGKFGITTDGDVIIRGRLDRETLNHYDLGITVTDGVFVAESRVAVEVIDSNDNPPVCKKPRYVESLSEATPIGSYILTVAASDKDEGQNAKLNYFLSGIGAESFILDMNSGILKTGSPLDRETQGLYKLVAHVRDAKSKAWECTSEIEISLTDVNDNSPVFSQRKYSVTVDENVDVRSLITKVHASDADLGINKKIQYMFVGQAYGQFAIDSASGLVTLAKPLDRELQAMYNLTIQAVDQGTPQLTAEASIIVIVRDINDNPPEFENKYYHVSVPETAIVGMDVVKVWATSKDLGVNAEVSYSIIGGNEHKKFSIHPKSGAIVISDVLDYERAKEYFLTIEAIDGGSPPLTNHASVNITIQDANDNAPMFSQTSYSAVLPEDVNIGYMAIQVVATDLDSGINSELSYNITSGNDFGHFMINSSTGVVFVSRRLDREMVSSYKMRVGAFDNGYPQRGTKVDVVIEVTDVNDCPPLFSAMNQTAIVQENKPIGFTIMKFLVTDADDPPNAGPYTFDIQDDESAFSIQDGVLKTAVKFSHSVKDKYLLRVRVYDNGTPPLSSESWITVKIIQESQYPPLIMPINVRITAYQDSFPGGQIGRVKATDQDPYDKLEYALPENTRLFEVDKDNGTLFAYAGLDDGEYLLNITVTDGKFSAVSQAVVSVSLVTDDMLEKSMMLTLGPVKPEDFVLTYQKNFERGIRGILDVRRRDVRILSIQPARGNRARRSPEIDDFIEILFAVSKPDEGFYSVDVIRKELKSKMRMFETMLGLQVAKVEENLCTVAGGDNCVPDNGKCADRMVLNEAKVIPIATDVMSFVSPEHRHVKECVCKPGFAGERCEIIANKCAQDPCPSFKVCVPDATSKGYSCQCARGYTGPRCDMQASMCRGQDCYHPRRPFSFDGQGFAVYALMGLRSVAIDLNINLHFKTLFPTGNLMYAAGRIDYSILEVVNGFLQYRFECGSGEGVAKISSRRVDDGMWHYVKLKRSGKAAELVLDETHRASGVSPGKNEIINLETHTIYFGAEVREPKAVGKNVELDIRMGFSGCMDDIMLEHVALPTRVGGSNDAATLSQIRGIDYGCSSLRKVPGPCGSQPCMNGGSCVERPSGQGGGFACLCRDRFHGRQCEIDRDPCADYPCLHGGTCTSDGNEFRCDCPAGLTGHRCDYGRFCNPNPCKNRGWCEEGLSSAVCQCRGFTGTNCEVDVDECLQNPCASGSTCVNTQGSFRCLCPQNTTGFYCGERMQPTNITSTKFVISLEELLGIVGVLIIIVICILLCVCIRRLRGKRGLQRRPLENGNVEERNMIPLLMKTNGQEIDCIGNPKMSNVDQVQSQTAFVASSLRPASYAPATTDSNLYNQQSNLNNFDTVRSYGSAADELEMYVPPPPDFLQNLNNHGPNGSSVIGICPGPSCSPRGDGVENPIVCKPWHVNDLDANKGAYYDSQKIRNGFYCGERMQPTNITSTKFVISLEELLGIVGVLIIIVICILLCVCIRRLRGKRGLQRRPLENGNVEERNMIPLLMKTNGQEIDCIGNPKMSNVDQVQSQTAFVASSLRPASYAPATTDSNLYNQQSNLNNFDTVRSYGSAADELEIYGSAADELEMYVPPPPDFLQNLNNHGPNGSSVIGICPGPSCSPRGDGVENPIVCKPWHVNDLDANKGAYYDSQKIRNVFILKIEICRKVLDTSGLSLHRSCL
ncbi:unnamed protein product [Notodromas monacha]|uniref:Protocadherin Fat 4 n=1 Tax=Notodromas monacha TaxID=399045 RepID=A0A7R9BSX1_9CRUS|nr:unnamed protein product [Notodromas monacha]CAG0921142.1 unnamed protein product [Notodromas monacha]